jgi:5,10-methenyltetrahydromethanopterin hydrogenase
MRNDIVTLEDLVLVHTTDKAYLVRDDDGEESWIPKSQVTNISFGKDIDPGDDGETLKEIIELEIPQWLADKLNL